MSLCSRWHWSVLPVSQVAEWPGSTDSPGPFCAMEQSVGVESGSHPRRCCRSWLSTWITNVCYLKPTCLISVPSEMHGFSFPVSRFRFHLGDSQILSLQIYWGHSERPPGNPPSSCSLSSLLACQRWRQVGMNCLESHAFVHHADVLIPTTTFFSPQDSVFLHSSPALSLSLFSNEQGLCLRPSKCSLDSVFETLADMQDMARLSTPNYHMPFNGGLVGMLLPLLNCSLTIWITPISFYKFLLYLSDHGFIFPYSLLNYNLISQEVNWLIMEKIKSRDDSIHIRTAKKKKRREEPEHFM